MMRAPAAAEPAGRPRLRRLAFAVLSATAASAALVTPAWGHAVVSPPVALSGTLQVFTLSVPTEREGQQTVAVRLSVPSGFAIDSFAPARGWKRRVAARGAGDAAVVSTVTWTGGSTPAGEAAVFQFNATPTEATAYAFKVRQTYGDDSVVDWTGDEDSDTPAPRIEAKASIGGGGNSTLSIAALLAGALGVVLGLGALLGRAGDRPLT